VEPWIYIAGEIGVRIEVIAFFGVGVLIVTPDDYQRELMIV
jgi:hypothetical protein